MVLKCYCLGLHSFQVDDQEPPVERLAETGERLEGLRGLKRADDAGHRAQNPFGAAGPSAERLAVGV